MIIFLRDQMADSHKKTKCCAIVTRHAEYFQNGVEIVYPFNGDIVQIPVNQDADFFWSDHWYAFFITYDNDAEVMLRAEFPNCIWFKD